MYVNPPLVNIEAEKMVVSNALNNPDSLNYLLEIINPSDFYESKFGLIYSAACRALIDGSINSVSITEALRDTAELVLVGGSEFIGSLFTEVKITDTECKEAANVIRNLAKKREEVIAARGLANALLTGEGDPDGMFDKIVNARINQISQDDFTDLGSIVGAVLSGNNRRIEPNLLRRDDGACLLYQARLNWLAAPPESMKSWVAKLAGIQEMMSGYPFVYVDFEESDGSTMAERIVAIAKGMGISDVDLMLWVSGPLNEDGTRDSEKRLLWYLPANGSFTGKMRNKILGILKRGARFVVLDGAAAAMGAAGLEEDKAKDVNMWLSGSVWPLVNAGAGVLVIDHVTKSAPIGNGGFANRSPRGSGAKLAAVSGAALMAEVEESGSAFTPGKVHLIVAKDRIGRIKIQRRSGRRYAGLVRSEPSVTANGIEVTNLWIESPQTVTEQSAAKRWDLICAEQISKLLSATGKPMTKTEIRDSLKEKSEANNTKGWHTTTTVSAFGFLETNNYISVDKQGRTENLVSLSPYRSEWGDVHVDDAPKFSENPF